MYFAQLLRDLNARMVSVETTGFHKENDKILWLQNAIEEVGNMTYQDPESGKMKRIDWDWLKDEEIVPTVASQEAYDLPTDMKFGGLRSVVIEDAEGTRAEFHIVTVDEYENQTSGYRNVATIKNGHLYLRVFSADNIDYTAYEIAGDDLIISYIRKPVMPVITSRGAITAFAAAGTSTTVSSASHGLADANVVTIIGTPNYDGIYSIGTIATGSFVIPAQFLADDACGTWYKSGLLEFNDEFAVPVVRLAFATCLEKEGKGEQSMKEQGDARNTLIALSESQAKQITRAYKGQASSTFFG